MISEFRRGPSPLSQGATHEGRSGPTAAQVTHDAHARYMEAVWNGNVFVASNPLVGATVAAAGASTQPLLAVVNPIGSGVNLVIWKNNFVSISGTVGAGIIGRFRGNVPNTLAVDNVTPVNRWLGSRKSAALAYSVVAAAIVNPVFLEPMIWFQAQAAGQTPYAEILDGDIVVPQGAAFALNPGAAGTTWVACASIEYEEVTAVS